MGCSLGFSLSPHYIVLCGWDQGLFLQIWKFSLHLFPGAFWLYLYLLSKLLDHKSYRIVYMHFHTHCQLLVLQSRSLPAVFSFGAVASAKNLPPPLIGLLAIALCANGLYTQFLFSCQEK